MISRTFSPDAAEVMEMLLKTQTGDNELSDDDPQLSYMISAWARICKILGPRFAPYLPVVMPAIMKTASMKPEVALLDNEELNGIENDSEDWQFVSLGEQQNFGIKTAGLEDKATGKYDTDPIWAVDSATPDPIWAVEAAAGVDADPPEAAGVDVAADGPLCNK